MKRIFLMIFTAALMFACNTETASDVEDDVVVADDQSSNDDGERSTTSNPRYNDLMLPSTSGVFRGISFDMSKDEVLDIETARSTVDIYQDETEDEVIVTTDMGKEILDFGDITYKFDEQGLYGIKVETYAVTLEGATEDFNMIIEHYTEKFGEPTIAEDGYYEFTATDKVSGNDYSIAIKNIDDVEESFGMYMYFDLM